MSILTRIKARATDFTNGIKIIAKGPKGIEAEGDKKLAYMSRIVSGQIDIYGVRTVRTQVIKSIESDFKRAAKKGQPTIESMIQNAIATPDYMKMLHRLGLEEPHIRVMAIQALKNAGQEWRTTNEQKQ